MNTTIHHTHTTAYSRKQNTSHMYTDIDSAAERVLEQYNGTFNTLQNIRTATYVNEKKKKKLEQ